MSQWLVSFDTDRIKEYLFATQDLSDIREASSLLDRLNNRRDQAGQDLLDIVKEIWIDFERDNPNHCIYAAGGGAMLLVPDLDKAKEMIKQVEKFYRRETVIASITGAFIEITNHELQNGFGKKAHYLGHLLRKRKDEKGSSRIFPVTSFIHFCASCAQHPAEAREGDELICRACSIKRKQANSEARRGLWKKLTDITKEELLPNDVPALWDKLLDDTLGNQTHLLHQFPKDFGAIGKSARRSGYIALIYADGNNMGKILEQLPDPEAYHHFSQQVDDLLRRVTYKALMKHVLNNVHKTLFEVLMIGGDDLMLVATADTALDVAIELMQEFEKYSVPLVKKHGLPFLSLGTGIVIAQDSFPIDAMQKLATALQKKAKRRSFKSGGGGAVDFMVVTSAGSESLDTIRDEVLTEKGFLFPPSHRENLKYRLTQRPYTLEELSALLIYGRNIKASGFPQSQLQAMYEGLFHSPIQASISVLQTIGQVKSDHRKPLEVFLNRFGPRSRMQFPPWGNYKDEGKDVRATGLGDLIEIYPFL